MSDDAAQKEMTLEEYVTYSLPKSHRAHKEFVELKKDSAILAALQAGGVDNWEWYDASLEDHYQEPEI